ncbi:hypothetical protein [Cytobacillus gottheilii]|uniref:hypothetical protein n=1 Tax=Cytobacillus gottheilii TaxID=859144 RepID=UPI0009BA485E|nr:hypothetical protein [Cytobacillus gottheilii]
MRDWLLNPWIWTTKAEEHNNSFVAGESVPSELMAKGESEYLPKQEWINKGYVKRQELVMFATELV